MRCYFLRDNRIEGVELLQDGSDEDLIRQATELYARQSNMHHFEVWDGRRLVYRSEPYSPAPPSN
jgi:hypothetical protein